MYLKFHSDENAVTEMASNALNEMEIDTRVDTSEKPNLKGDRFNFILLSFLYFLQFVVVGLPLAISLVLQKNKNVSYNDQAEFSVIGSVYAFKILWAPIIDSLYSKRFGRRKTWLIPLQYLIGTLLMIISLNIDDLLGSGDDTKVPNVRLLTLIFSGCVLCASTQDIAVDGWSLTIFQKRNIGYVAPCEKVGSTLGHFCGFVVFLLLDSAEFCNRFRSVPQDYGFVTISQFLLFWSIVYITITTLILLFKKENTPQDEPNPELKESYVTLWEILKIRPVQMLGAFMLTFGIGFGPMKHVSPLKLLDAGITRDKLALLAVPSLPFQLTLPFVLRRYLVGPRPLQFFMTVYVLRLLNNIIYASSIFFITRSENLNDGILPDWYYWPLVFVYNMDNVTGFLMFSALIAFCARVSDPRYGGIYMTFLMSMHNVGHFWVSSLFLWLVGPLTIQTCSFDVAKDMNICQVHFDGYYIEMIMCTLLGSVWIIWARKQIAAFEKLDSSAFVVRRK